MKKIGEGWQYSVYDLDNERVLKKFHSPIKSYWVILKCIFPFREDSLAMVPSFSKSAKKKALASFEIIKNNKIPAPWLGNPKFLGNLDYEQDKAKPLHDVFENSDTASIKSIIDDFIVFNKRLLENGVIDKSFNITKNYGLDKDGNIILIDIGELFDDPACIKKQILDRAWDKSYVAGCIKNKEVREYFIKKMDENFKITEEITLRRAGVEDIDKILEVEKSVVGTKIYSGLEGRDDAVKEITENIFYLIIKNGKVVGDVAYEMKDENHACISGLAVAKEFQGQGIAKQAMKMILEKLKDIKLVDLVTHPENIKAIGLYNSLGFKQIGEQMENYFDDGEPRIRMILEK